MPSEEHIQRLIAEYEASLAEEAGSASEEANVADRRRGRKVPPYATIHVDDTILVVDKASGIATIPERGHDDSLKTLTQEEFGRNWTVHRIDKETSGIVLFARTAEAHRDLSEQFRERTVEKRYLAIVEGELPDDRVEIDIPLATDPGHAGRIRPSANGKEALTILTARERFDGFTLVEANPKTGRQHQIRVHCRAVGLPLLVDRLYGSHSEFFLSSIKRKFKNYGKDERPLIDHLTLHAEELTVRHPGSGESVTFSAEPPKEFRAVLTQLRKLRPAS